MAGNGGYQDVIWVGHGGSQSQGSHGYTLVMRQVCGGRPRAGMWSAERQRAGCGWPSEHGECDKTMQLWVGQRRGHIMQVGCHRSGRMGEQEWAAGKMGRRVVVGGWANERV